MRNKELIFFDVDGVLVFSMDKSTTRLCQIIEAVRLDFDLKIIENNWGHSFQNVVIPRLAESGNWPDSKKELVMEKSKDFFENTHFHSPDGLSDKFNLLKASGYELGIITNRDHKMLEKAFNDMSVDLNIFTYLQTADDCFRKPDPRVFKNALKYFEAKRIIFVGDSPICDLPAAYNGKSKIDFAGITSIVHKKEHFVAAGVPEKLIYDSVLDFIDQMLVLQTA